MSSLSVVRTRRQSRLIALVRVVSGVTAAQAVVQVLGALVGFLLLRWLSVEQFAQYSVAIGFATTLTVLVDLGLASAVTALVGERRADRSVIATYVVAARSLRVALLAVGMPPAAVSFWLITRGHGWSMDVQLLLFGSVAATVVARTSFDLYGAPLMIERRYAAFYRPQMVTNALRLIASGTLYGLGLLTGWLAAALNALALFLVGRAFRRSSDLGGDHPASEAVAVGRKEIRSYLAPLIPGAVFFAFQSQIAILLVTIFGDVRAIADTGALARLGQLFALASALSPVLIGPYVAALTRDSLARRFGQILLVAHMVGLIAVAIGLLVPGPVLFLLGDNYSHLTTALQWFMVASAMSYVASVIYTMNLARRFVWWWGSLLGPLLVILAQAVGVSTLDIGTAVGVQQLAVVTAIPMLLISYVSIGYGFWKGAKVLPSDSAHGT